MYRPNLVQYTKSSSYQGSHNRIVLELVVLLHPQHNSQGQPWVRREGQEQIISGLQDDTHK